MSSEVKRYDPINSDGTCGTCVEDPDYGAYVEFADYTALEAELAKLRAGQEPVGWQQRYLDPDEGPSMWQPCDMQTMRLLKDRSDYEVRPVFAAPQPSAVPDADIACDRSYRNGLIAGFGFGISGDEAGYQRSLSCYQQGIHEALAAAPSAPATVPRVNQQLLEALEAVKSLPYQMLFNAMADAVRITCGGSAVSVSVKGFKASIETAIAAARQEVK